MSGPIPRPPLERFLERVQVCADGCWRLNLDRSDQHYAEIRLEGGGRVGAHRFAYEFFVGPIPPTMHLDHLCRTPACVNPGHLEPVTAQENTLRGVSPSARNAAKDRCPRGHAYDAENTYVFRGRRNCRECCRQAVRRYRERSAA